MSQRVIYSGIKAAIKEVDAIKHVDMWNQQLSKPEYHDKFMLPAAFIEMLPQEFVDEGAGIQRYVNIARIHLAFEHYKNTPEEIYDLKQAVHKKVHMLELLDDTPELEYPTSKLRRVNETPNYDYGHIITFEMDYASIVQDVSADKRIQLDLATKTPVITVTPVDEIT